MNEIDEIANKFIYQFNSRHQDELLKLDFTWPSIGLLDKAVITQDEDEIKGISSYLAIFIQHCWLNFDQVQSEIKLEKNEVVIYSRGGKFLKSHQINRCNISLLVKD